MILRLVAAPRSASGTCFNPRPAHLHSEYELLMATGHSGRILCLRSADRRQRGASVSPLVTYAPVVRFYSGHVQVNYVVDT